MNERLYTVRASLRLARRVLVRQVALVHAGATPEPAAYAEALAHLDDALEELEAFEKAGPLRAVPGGRGRHERR
jgi:hypothetical protein